MEEIDTMLLHAFLLMDTTIMEKMLTHNLVLLNV
jgi:hypothetical protein